MHRANVLRTTFETAFGEATVTDFIPFAGRVSLNGPPERAIYRQVSCTEGSVDPDVEFRPWFDYAWADTIANSVLYLREAEVGNDDRAVRPILNA